MIISSLPLLKAFRVAAGAREEGRRLDSSDEMTERRGPERTSGRLSTILTTINPELPYLMHLSTKATASNKDKKEVEERIAERIFIRRAKSKVCLFPSNLRPPTKYDSNVDIII